MAQLSAYSLLEGFEKRKSITEVLSYRVNIFKNTIVCEIDPVPNNFNPKTIINDPFLAQHYHTGNAFIQQTTQDVNTHIGNLYFYKKANLGVPYAPPFYDHLNEQSFNVYEIEHCAFTVSISYFEKYNAFAISACGQTILCENKNDIDDYTLPMHERPCRVAYQFFTIYNKFSKQQKASFQKDLIHRSLVGHRGVHNLEWFAIMEHYADQRMLPFDQVREFLKYYGLDGVAIVETQSSLSDLPAIQSRLYNQTIPVFHDKYRGTTLYFWNGKRFLGCCFISNKHYEILNKLRKQILHKNQKVKDIYDYLRGFKLTEQETDFYLKYTDYMHSQYDPQDNFSTFTQKAFNVLHSQITQQEQKNLVLSSCIKQTIIVVIPIGIQGMGYEELCTQLQKNCYHMAVIQDVNQINENGQIFFLKQVCTINQLQSINQKCQQLPYSIKTIALQPECTHEYLIKGKYRFPFSFKFIMFCLLQVLEDNNAVKELILQLKQFEEKSLQNLGTDITIKCRYMPSQREKDDLYSEIVEQDFEAALNSSNEQLIESLQQYKETVDNENTNLAEEAKRILDLIEKETKIKLRKRAVQFKLTQQQYYGLFIQRPNWDQIDNFIIDCLQIVVKQYPNEAKVNSMYQILKSQLFNSGKQVFERESKPYISTNKLFDKEYDIDVQIAIIIPDGIVILQPQELGLGLLQDIPVYYHTIDVTKSCKISQICQKNVKKMQKQAVPIETVQQQDVEMFNKTHNSYIVKFKPIKIRLVGKIVD